MYYIITNGKYWVIENPIRPGEYMESTKSSNAKQFTFKQAKNLLNARSKKLGWIRNGYSMVGEDGNKPTVSPKAKGNGGVFLNENDIVVDLNLLDQIEDECTKFLSLAAWDESELSNMLESLSTYLSKLDSEESDIKHALVIYTYKHDGKLPQAHRIAKGTTMFDYDDSDIEYIGGGSTSHSGYNIGLVQDLIEKYSGTNKVHRDFEQGWQGIEYKLNSVSSSRGDYPFVTITIGLATSKFGKMAAITLLNVHKDGQGKKGFKRPVLFPKIVFLYDKELHGDGSDKYPSADVFNAGMDCSAKTMYPDWLSLTGDGYVAEMYKKYKKVVSPMGCRAFLSPWYERGGMHPADENDTPIFKGRFNLGVVSLHLPMILAKARRESKDFYEVLDYYLELVRGLHKRTYDYIGELHASVNPVAFCEGGFLGGHLNPDDKIKSILPPMTMSYGITALNELQRLYNGKSIREDGQFALEVMQYINDYTNRIKEEDHILYAIYGTPAESLCGLQVEQFRKIYGIIENVSDKEYVSNSFHCHVSEDMNPIEKQDKEGRFWNLFNGGKIQYCRYNLGYNKQAIKTLVLRAMDKGFYEGVNLAMCYCEDCGYQQVEMDTCPKCGSKMITKIDRMNGYLGFTRVHGQTRYNEAKNAEIKDRVSM